MREQRKQKRVHCVLQSVCMWCMMYSFLGHCTLLNNKNQHGNNQKKRNFDQPFSEKNFLEVDDSCKELPTILPAGSFFLDKGIQMGSSPDAVDPPFHVGTVFKDKNKVSWHMMADIANFYLIKELLKGNERGVALDIGANQGFYTYYLASLGMDVHSFEINEANFRALQHGKEFNPIEVANRVYLYPLGLGEKNERFDIRGSNYEGFLRKSEKGSILGVSLDCLAFHLRQSLDFTKIDFIKLDVEGFEIAVLKGAQNFLFQHSNLKGLLAEVGPIRWERASISFSTGVHELKRLSTLFKLSYILLREEDHAATCPVTLGDRILKDTEPQVFHGVQMYKIDHEEWEALLKKMETNRMDCNIFFKN